MHGVAALLSTAAISYVVARFLRLPAIPFLLAGGVGLSILGGAPADTLENALVLGVSFLLFVVGLELDPRRVRAQRSAALRVGVTQFIVLATLGFGTALVLGLGIVEAGYVALALTASSTFVGVRLLQRRRQMFEPFGRLVIGVLLLQDILVLVCIPVVMGVADGWIAALVLGAGVGLLGGMALLVRRWGAPLLLRVADETELVLLVSLAILFVFLGAAGVMGLPLVVGAFLAGAALSRFPVNGIVRAELAPIGDFFAAIFFTALGAFVRIPTAVEMWHAGILVFVVIVVTPPLVALVATRSGFTVKSALEAGLLLSQTSELSLVVGIAGVIQGHISEGLYVVIALLTLVTMLLTPFLATDRMSWRLTTLWPESPEGSSNRVSGHVLVLGAGSTGLSLVEDLMAAACPVAVIDDDPGVIGELRRGGVPAIRGDASDPRVLERATVGRARAVISTIRRPRDNAALLAMAGDVPVLVRVFDEEDAAWVRARGGRPVIYSEATAEGLISWYLEHRNELERNAAARMAESSATTGAVDG